MSADAKRLKSEISSLGGLGESPQQAAHVTHVHCLREGGFTSKNIQVKK